jgi:hypothetical protein
MDEVTMKETFQRLHQFPPLITILPQLHTQPSPPHEVCDSPDQAAQYHTLGGYLEPSPLTRHLAGLRVKAV